MRCTGASWQFSNKHPCSSKKSCCFSQGEAESLTGATNPIKAGQELIRESSHTRWVILKMGSRGSLLVTKSSVCYAPAFKVDVVDTVGCGDSFTAAIAYGFLQNIPPMNTLVLANAVGGATAMGCGAGRNVASLEKVIELLNASDLSLENFWGDKLVEDDLEADLVILSNITLNGVGDKVKRVSVEKVVSDLMPRLQIKQKERWRHCDERKLASSLLRQGK